MPLPGRPQEDIGPATTTEEGTDTTLTQAQVAIVGGSGILNTWFFGVAPL